MIQSRKILKVSAPDKAWIIGQIAERDYICINKYNASSYTVNRLLFISQTRKSNIKETTNRKLKNARFISVFIKVFMQ